MNTPPEIPPVQAPEISSDDKLWVLLCFLLTPIIPIITLLMDDKKNRPFIKYHLYPTLILGAVESIVSILLSYTLHFGYIGGLLWILNLILGLKANGGVYTDIPVITDFSKKQGWS